ncbi:hypothetical protein ACFQE0_04235 [Methylobacterium komagatae]|uniref:Uncharacterized protein n=1 Tax=Methylobacterium komagatae TaxID=374425 RepID=A0ABW2BEQ2_9HYPH
MQEVHDAHPVKLDRMRSPHPGSPGCTRTSASPAESGVGAFKHERDYVKNSGKKYNNSTEYCRINDPTDHYLVNVIFMYAEIGFANLPAI